MELLTKIRAEAERLKVHQDPDRRVRTRLALPRSSSIPHTAAGRKRCLRSTSWSTPHRAWKEGRLKLKPDTITETVTYHDPCNFARSGWVVEQPRELLKAICTNYVEMTPNRQDNICCGGGGGTVSMDELRPYRTVVGGRMKAEQIRATGAKYCVAPCANCKKQLRELVEEHGIRLPDCGPSRPVVQGDCFRLIGARRVASASVDRVRTRAVVPAGVLPDGTGLIAGRCAHDRRNCRSLPPEFRPDCAVEGYRAADPGLVAASAPPVGRPAGVQRDVGSFPCGSADGSAVSGRACASVARRDGFWLDGIAAGAGRLLHIACHRRRNRPALRPCFSPRRPRRSAGCRIMPGPRCCWCRS